MAILNKGQTFSDGEQVTSAKLNTAVDGATFASGAVDDVSTQLSGGAIIVKDGGITTAKIADSNVTKGKMENVANMKVLGNTSGSSDAPQEVSILDEDDMVSDSNTSIPTQQSVKAYVDGGFSPTNYTGGESVTFPNGLIMKWGVVTIPSTGGTVSFGTAFPNNCINVITSAHGVDALAGSAGITAFSTSGFTANPKYGNDFHWQAIGY
jgi:hypothetical protein